ncbi:MAG: Type 1 glutamine amidotransferase-like domain-containing protein [Candidatus Levyibacteriota bacterium]
MKFFLTSNGLKGQLTDIFVTLLKKPASENSVAFDITAAYGEEDNPTWFEKFKDQLRQQGVINIQDLDLRNKNQEQVEEMLSTKDIIFVNGGNTFFLLDCMRKAGFEKALKKFLSEDKLYIGVSAGGIVVTPTIAIAGVEPGDANNIGMQDFTGLSMVDFEFSPHVPDMVSYDSVENFSKTTPHKVYAVDDYAAVLVQDDKVSVIGDGKYKIYNGEPS